MMNMPARPYLEPALGDTIDDIKDIVAEEAKIEIIGES